MTRSGQFMTDMVKLVSRVQVLEELGYVSESFCWMSWCICGEFNWDRIRWQRGAVWGCRQCMHMSDSYLLLVVLLLVIWQDFNNPFDLFETFFGGMGGSSRSSRNRPMQGDDERYDLLLDFQEAVFGVEKNIEVARLEMCNTCDGSGAKPGTTPSSCSTCGGQGQVMTTARTPLGDFRQVATCPACRGSGEISTPCTSCSGDGRVRKSKLISLKVPAGVDSGSRLRVRSEGNAGKRGGPPGDLYVFINVRLDPNLKRDGNNILISTSISYVDAILGTTVKVPTVDGNVDLKIPAGTQPGTTLVMSKRGVPLLGKTNMRGDELVKVQVEIPKRLSSEERKLIEELADLSKPKAASSR